MTDIAPRPSDYDPVAAIGEWLAGAADPWWRSLDLYAAMHGRAWHCTLRWGIQEQGEFSRILEIGESMREAVCKALTRFDLLFNCPTCKGWGRSPSLWEFNADFGKLNHTCPHCGRLVFPPTQREIMFGTLAGWQDKQILEAKALNPPEPEADTPNVVE